MRYHSVIVETRDVDEGRDVKPAQKPINWHDSSDRKWLMNHLHWAMTNRKSVELHPDSN